MGLNFAIDMIWGHLIRLSLSKKRQKKISRHKGCRQMVIETVHCASSSILKVRFLGHPVLRGRKGIRTANPSARNLTTCNGLRATTLPSKDEALWGQRLFGKSLCCALNAVKTWSNRSPRTDGTTHPPRVNHLRSSTSTRTCWVLSEPQMTTQRVDVDWSIR